MDLSKCFEDVSTLDVIMVDFSFLKHVNCLMYTGSDKHIQHCMTPKWVMFWLNYDSMLIPGEFFLA